ncbi:MAG: cysteine desulfurase [Anaerolineales bacterium]|nr:cysteine desulfurase [Anaerolineales bacterium]
MTGQTIYLDHSATTPVDERVVAAMLPYWTEYYGNPSSGHAFGRAAQLGLSRARRTVAELLGAQPSEILFTGCGSESDNLALRGVMWPTGGHLITSVIEHEAVKTTAVQLRDQFGMSVTFVGVDEHGRVDPAEIAAAIRPDTRLISIMAANNEIGTIQPILQIGELARAHGVLFHTDAIQAAVSFDWNLADMPIDLLSLAPHKFYGPKGVGLLYVRQNLTLLPTLTGGGQENGRRAGTVNVPFAVGAARALEIALAQRAEDVAHYTTLRDHLIEGLLSAFAPEQCRLTGHATQRLPHHASFAFNGVHGNDLLMHLDMIGVAGSSGSACATGNPEPSSTLVALGLGESWTRGGLRLTVGRQNGLADVAHVVAELPSALQKLQAFTAVYNN